MAKKKRQKTVSAGLDARRPLWSSSRLKSTAITLTVAVVVAAGGVWGFTALWNYVINLEEFRLVPGEQELRDLAGKSLAAKPWIDLANLKAYWLSQAGDPSGVLRRPTSLFARGLTESVYEALIHAPWVHAGRPGGAPTVFVRRNFPNGLDIRVKLRRPAFTVSDPKRAYLLDDEGVVLDTRLFRPPADLKRRPVIRFMFDPGIPELGKRWDDEAIGGGMHLVRVLEENGILASVPLAEIRASEAPRGSTGASRTLALIPRKGGEILWGDAPSPGKLPSPAEASPEQKFRNLVEMLAHYKSVLPQYTIDVRFAKPGARPREL